MWQHEHYEMWVCAQGDCPDHGSALECYLAHCQKRRHQADIVSRGGYTSPMEVGKHDAD